MRLKLNGCSIAEKEQRGRGKGIEEDEQVWNIGKVVLSIGNVFEHWKGQ